MADDPTLPKGYKLDSDLTLPKGYVLDVKPTDIPNRQLVTRGDAGQQTVNLERSDTAKAAVAPQAGRYMAETLPAVGSFAGPAGTVAGTGAMLMAKKYAPETFGEYNPDISDQMGTLLKELLTNNVLPGAVGKGAEMIRAGKPGMARTLSNFPAFREGAVKQLTERIQQQLDPSVIGAGRYQMIPDFQPVGDYQPITIKPGEPQVPLRQGQPFRPATPPSVMPSGDIKTAGLKIADMIGVGGKDINAENAFAEFTGKNAQQYRDSMPPETYDSTKQMLSTMKDLQKKNTTDRVVNMSEGRLVWALGGGSLGGIFGHPTAGSLLALGVREAPVVLNSYLGKIMSNPETAKLVTAAMLTPTSAPQAGLIQKALTEVLPRVVADAAATPDR